MTEPKKVFISAHGLTELNKGYYATAFPDKDKVSKFTYHSDTHLKEWIEKNTFDTNNEQNYLNEKQLVLMNF